MKKGISKTAVLLSALAGSGYGIYHQDIWMGVLGFFFVGGVVYGLEYLLATKK